MWQQITGELSMTGMTRRELLLAGAAVGLTAALPAAAQTGAWPSKPVKVVAAFAPGGVADLMARLMAQQLQDSLKQPFVVENRPGAGGIIGTDFVAKATPDGYTLLLTTSAAQGVAPVLQPNVPYDPVKDFTHIAFLGRGPSVMLANAEAPYKTLKDFIAAARKKSDSVNFGSGGQGSLGHLTGELVARTIDVPMTHIAYRGSAPAQVALLGNEIEIIVDNLSAHAGQIQEGKLRPLGLAAEQRLDSFPDIPTFAEQGYPTIVSAAWFGITGPARMPADLTARIHAESQKIVAQDVVKARMRELGLVADASMSPQQYSDFVGSENRKWGDVIKAAGIKP
jgi:tripartite-type tricarboxylate transporter receptor subunit TctC